MTRVPWVIALLFLAAALLEVGGDATIRFGLRGHRLTIVVAGGLCLAAYGVTVNLVRWDFSRLLGVYVAVFACASVAWGRFILHEQIPPATWYGLALIVAGGLLIQFGAKP